MVSPGNGTRSEDRATQEETSHGTVVRGSARLPFLLSSTLSDQQGVGASTHSTSRLTQHASMPPAAVPVSIASDQSGVASLDTNTIRSIPNPGSFFLGLHSFQAVEEMDLPEFVREHNTTLSFPEKVCTRHYKCKSVHLVLPSYHFIGCLACSLRTSPLLVTSAHAHADPRREDS